MTTNTYRCPECAVPWRGPKPLARVVRECINALDAGEPRDANYVVAALREAGAVRGIHCSGITPESFTSEMTVQWFAGQILETLESGAFFAVNSMINCVDKFCPAPAATGAAR